MIRKATINDVDKIMRIWFEASVRAHSFVEENYWKDREDDVRNIYLPQAQTFVFEDRRQIKGFISIVSDNFIGALFVTPQSQQHKIGTKLLAYVRRKRPNLTLNVYAKNEQALKFYQKNDFKIISQGKDCATNEEELRLSWARGCKNGYIKRFPQDS